MITPCQCHQEVICFDLTPTVFSRVDISWKDGSLLFYPFPKSLPRRRGRDFNAAFSSVLLKINLLVVYQLQTKIRSLSLRTLSIPVNEEDVCYDFLCLHSYSPSPAGEMSRQRQRGFAISDCKFGDGVR